MRLARWALLTAALGLSAPAVLTLSSRPAMAQVSDANVRAVNTARNWAVNANGGLSVYTPAACMFETASGGGACLMNVTPQGFYFRFAGGAPGWQVEGQRPTRETALQISPDGRTVLNVSYNGPPR